MKTKNIKLIISLLVAFVLLITSQSFADQSNITWLTKDQTYTLKEDISGKRLLTYYKAKVTIDLNGHNIICDSDDSVIKAQDGSEVTIIGKGTIKNTNENGMGIVVLDGSKLTIDSKDVNVEAEQFGVLVEGNSTFTMNNGTITAKNNAGIAGNGTNEDQYKNYTININGGTINSEIKTEGYASCGVYSPNVGTVNITGGIINSSKGPGVVLRAGTANITGGTINAKGDPTFAGKVGDAKSPLITPVALVVDSKAGYPGLAQSKDGQIKATVSGTATLIGTAGQVQSTENNTKNVKIEITAGEYTTEPAKETVPEGYKSYKTLDGKYIVAKATDEKEQIESKEIAEKEVPTTDKKEINAFVEKTNGAKVAGYYDINLFKVVNGIKIEQLATSAEKQKVTVKTPSTLKAVENGYNREYFVVRFHDNKAEKLDATLNKDGTVTFETDKFSTYALAYVDTKKAVEEKDENTTEENAVIDDNTATENTEAENQTTNTTEAKDEKATSNPKTGDVIAAVVAVLVISVLGFGISKKIKNS